MSLDDIQASIAAEDFARALTVALRVWRETRSTELADLIDRITARCELPQPPHTRGATHRWWMSNALDPDPVMIGALLVTFPKRMYVVDVPWETMRARWKVPNPVIDGVAAIPPTPYLVQWAQQRGEPLVWNRNVPNWVDRAAAIYTWPDDPRCARVLTDLLCDDGAYLEGAPADGPWPATVERLRALGDRRIAATLAQRMPKYCYSSRQRAVKALAESLPTGVPVRITEPSIGELAAQLPAELPRVQVPDLDPLWDEVAAAPDDDAPRLVLADALLAAGDNRGELIVLQCSPDPERRNHAETQAHRLIKREWERWMGDLALVLARRGTTMRRGMLDAIRIGLADTPEWAWKAIEGHRELSCVREVRPAMVGPLTFAAVVAALPSFPRVLQIDAHEVVQKLLETHEEQPVEIISYAPTSSHVSYRRARPLVLETFAMIAKLAPDLVRLDLGSLWWHGGEFRAIEQPAAYFVDLLRSIQAMFPRLAKIRIEQSAVRENARHDIARVPGVELVTEKLGF